MKYVIELEGSHGDLGYAYHDPIEGWIATRILTNAMIFENKNAASIIIQQKYSTWKGQKTIRQYNVK